MIDEEDGQLKHSAFDISSDIHFVGRRPSLLGYNGALRCTTTIIQMWCGAERDVWRCTLHQVGVACDIPRALTVYYPIVSQEVLGRWCPEQEHEIVISVLGVKRMSDESVDEDGASRYDAL